MTKKNLEPIAAIDSGLPTRDEIIALAPGRDLDVLTLVHVFGFTEKSDLSRFVHATYKHIHTNDVPKFSTNITAAWQVIKYLQKHGTHVGLHCWCNSPYMYSVDYQGIGQFKSKTEGPFHTGPEAIIKASLLALLEVN